MLLWCVVRWLTMLLLTVLTKQGASADQRWWSNGLIASSKQTWLLKQDQHCDEHHQRLAKPHQRVRNGAPIALTTDISTTTASKRFRSTMEHAWTVLSNLCKSFGLYRAGAGLYASVAESDVPRKPTYMLHFQILLSPSGHTNL